MNIYQKKNREMSYLNRLYKLDDYSHYEQDEYNKENTDEISKYIHTNFKKMNHTEKCKLLMKCLSEHKIDKELLLYEMEYYKPKKDNTINLNQYAQYAQKLLSRYQWKAGGFKIEDKEWEIYTPDNQTKYHVKNNQLLMENSIARGNEKHKDFNQFMDNIVRILSNVSDNISVNYKCYECKKDSIVWIILKFVDTRIQYKKVEL